MPRALQLPIDPAYPSETDRVAVLVESRQHPCIGFVVRTVLHYLEDDWSLQIFHGRDNLEYIEQELVREYDADGAASMHPDPHSLLDRIIFSPLEVIVEHMAEDNAWPDWMIPM